MLAKKLLRLSGQIVISCCLQDPQNSLKILNIPPGEEHLTILVSLIERLDLRI